MTYLRLLFILVLLSSSWGVSGQNKNATDFANHFGIDTKNSIIVCHQKLVQNQLNQLQTSQKITLGDQEFALLNAPTEFTETNPFLVVKAQDTFQVFISTLPILKLEIDATIVKNKKSAGTLTYFDNNSHIEAAILIKLRGNSALKYPKKSYSFDLKEDAESTKGIDYALAGLRLDDDWILNSIYNEPLRIRSLFASKLWLEICKPKPNNRTQKYKLGTDAAFVEVFKNNTYLGLYTLMEPVDRKQLNIQKIKDNTVYGELLKASAFTDATTFKAAPKFNNAFPTWGGYEPKYPYVDFTAHYDNIHEFVAFVSQSDAKTFTDNIESYLDLDNAIDYFLLMNALRATDNWGKNYYLAKDTKDAPYFFVPWDLDGVLGIIQDGKQISTTNDVLSNNLFDRLLQENPANFKARLKSRWQELRASSYSYNALEAKLIALSNQLEQNELYTRDNLVWQLDYKYQEQLDYMLNWLKERLEFLDGYTAKLN